MTKRTLRSASHKITSSVSSVNIGHLRRAQQRLQRSLRGDEPEDILVQATAGAVFASLAVALLRSPGVGKMLSRLIPMVAFAGVYTAMSRRSES